MKNIILIAIIILTFFISCRKSTLKITKPDASFFLGKMKAGNYTNGNDSFEVSNDGKNITIGSGNNTNNYTFESDIMGIGGIYQDTNSSNYIGVFPIGGSMHTVTMGKKEKEALTKIIEVVGEADSLKVIEGLSKVNGGKLDADSITQNLDDKKKEEVKKIIESSGLSGKDFGKYEKYEKT
ncbi:hypothetical protein EPJ69_11135 [Brachyspira aalborgi]|uniref:Uncharacterized protein n=1 Tax=Brachyspira aalborgi TaxID=29522 RepID=A0A5C8DYA2_9SPIR|nr:hypothetical protein [Brachyspira aalborgi]TXJ30114.1 hypothetical protein EPJ69_11135 [Brachyspira aalborgi]